MRKKPTATAPDVLAALIAAECEAAMTENRKPLGTNVARQIGKRKLTTSREKELFAKAMAKFDALTEKELLKAAKECRRQFGLISLSKLGELLEINAFAKRIDRGYYSEKTTGALRQLCDPTATYSETASHRPYIAGNPCKRCMTPQAPTYGEFVDGFCPECAELRAQVIRLDDLWTKELRRSRQLTTK
jgi:hypothetical protein